VDAADWDQVDLPELAEWKVPQILEAKLRHGRGLILAGPVGTGKSSVAALIAKGVLALPGEVVRTVRWESVAEMVDEMEAKRDGKFSVERRLRLPDLLVLDDLGVDKLAEWQIADLDRIVDARYRRRRSTIVTTNLQISEIARDPAYGRITSRWRETCDAYVMNGEDRRRPE
jgi:DNA replication protein DnaC